MNMNLFNHNNNSADDYLPIELSAAHSPGVKP